MRGSVRVAPGHLEGTLRAARERGRKLLVPYVTAGLPLGAAPGAHSDSRGRDRARAGGNGGVAAVPNRYSGAGGAWIDVVRAVVEAGADAVEVGIPFSDPVMDGPIIQEASRRALEAGTTPRGTLAELTSEAPQATTVEHRHGTPQGSKFPEADLPFGAPIVVMTYYNVAHSFGLGRFADALAVAGVAAAILPDLPLDEAGPWRQEAARAGVETVMLVAPTTTDDGLVRITSVSSGFVYAVGVMGVTGLRATLAASALDVARRAKAVTDKPVLVGVGVSDGAQAREICAVADGVVIGSALISILLSGGGADRAADFVGGVRAAIDGG